ncbi:hypothetical protein G5V59_00185 [Nocardioides sp. W3-2-3]|uniref:hypothetical protein n=1 Tax=Nocardioides convexus TaxID=2712224 RepID=UPI0024185E02|nr:hypothetical protein [Nocardioides convexus]NGZ99391.1 hypothetical protein [Nocardioides convexus]
MVTVTGVPPGCRRRRARPRRVPSGRPRACRTIGPPGHAGPAVSVVSLSASRESVDVVGSPGRGHRRLHDARRTDAPHVGNDLAVGVGDEQTRAASLRRGTSCPRRPGHLQRGCRRGSAANLFTGVTPSLRVR